MFKNSGFIYICEFDNGLVKIGKSLNNPETRIKTHESTMAITGSKLLRSWKSESHQKFSENEKILIDYISDFSTGGSKEWAKIEFESVLSKAKGLDFVSEVDFTEKTINDDKFLESGFFDHNDRKWVYSSSSSKTLTFLVKYISCHDLVHYVGDSGFSQFELVVGIMIYLDMLCVEEFTNRILYVLDDTNLVDEIIDEVLTEGQIEITKRFNK